MNKTTIIKAPEGYPVEKTHACADGAVIDCVSEQTALRAYDEGKSVFILDMRDESDFLVTSRDEITSWASDAAGEVQFFID